MKLKAVTHFSELKSSFDEWILFVVDFALLTFIMLSVFWNLSATREFII